MTSIIRDIYKHNTTKPVIHDSHRRHDTYIDLKKGEVNKSFESMIFKSHNIPDCDIM